MNTRAIVLWGGLGLLLVVGAVSLWPKSGVRKWVGGALGGPDVTAKPAPAPAPAAPTNAVEFPPLVPIDRSYMGSRWAAWLQAPERDPFRMETPPPPKVVLAASPVGHLKLMAIWMQTGSRLAVINKAVYGEGDELLGFRILRIDPESVLVQGPEKQDKVTFFSYVPPEQRTAVKGTNWVERLLGPEQQKLYY